MTVVLTLWHFGDVYKVKKWYDNDDVAPVAPIADSAAGGESEDSGDGSSIISEVSGSGDNGGDGGLEDGASARNKSRTGSRAIAPSDGSGPVAGVVRIPTWSRAAGTGYSEG
ncbi:hypothetical protein E4U46_004281 [Claviceps purpurea]|nr:hypothetical protein E4U46_004281 [Claviceps purpurea]